jgi:hypothetical protein
LELRARQAQQHGERESRVARRWRRLDLDVDADTKLIASFYIGDRGYGAAREFIDDLAERLANRVQLTSDGYRAYLKAVGEAFGGGIDYAMLVKIYGQDHSKSPERRYIPAECHSACNIDPLSRGIGVQN